MPKHSYSFVRLSLDEWCLQGVLGHYIHNIRAFYINSKYKICLLGEVSTIFVGGTLHIKNSPCNIGLFNCVAARSSSKITQKKKRSSKHKDIKLRMKLVPQRHNTTIKNRQVPHPNVPRKKWAWFFQFESAYYHWISHTSKRL